MIESCSRQSADKLARSQTASLKWETRYLLLYTIVVGEHATHGQERDFVALHAQRNEEIPAPLNIQAVAFTVGVLTFPHCPVWSLSVGLDCQHTSLRAIEPQDKSRNRLANSVAVSSLPFALIRTDSNSLVVWTMSSQSVDTLKTYLGKQLRIRISDGRVIEGIFQCMDKDLNFVLAGAVEYYACNDGKW
jgi:small nuclear ribonucleoprotein (snRNP)-like protein